MTQEAEAQSGESAVGIATALQALSPVPKLPEITLDFAKRIEAALGGGPLQRTARTEEAVRKHLSALYRQAGLNLPAPQAQRLYEAVMDELFGLGPLEPLLRDDSVTEIMVNGPRLAYVERQGKLEEVAIDLVDAAHMERIIQRIIRPLGRRLDAKWPMVDARLPDGSRVNIIVPPCAVNGPTITIRKFARKRLTVEDLVRFGSLTPQIAEFLKACVQARLNIVVCGGTGSGKTTLLNVLSSFIPANERIVTIEDSAELQLHQRHVVTLEAKPPEADGTGRVTIRDLVINALRMRPDRIVVGECRGGEALDMLQAMNTGHDGSLTTLHANSPRDALARMETMVLMAGMDLPVRVIREQIASAVDLIIQQARMRDGSRKVVSVTEVQGMEGDVIVLQDIFVFREEGMDENGRVKGQFRPAGVRPRFMARLAAAGIHLPAEIFAVPGEDPRGGRPGR
ncbi:MAG: CpaF family protein [Chloroflexia bacterium]